MHHYGITIINLKAIKRQKGATITLCTRVRVLRANELK
jgi:hypothetical protein